MDGIVFRYVDVLAIRQQLRLVEAYQRHSFTRSSIQSGTAAAFVGGLQQISKLLHVLCLGRLDAKGAREAPAVTAPGRSTSAAILFVTESSSAKAASA
jgi:hypothetical protein